MEDEKLPLTAHLEELRNCLIVCLIAVGIGFCVSYGFSDKIFLILSRPLRDLLPEGSTFIFTEVSEAFFTYLKLSFFAGIFLASPVILHQIWKFTAPGLYANEKRYVFPFVLLSTIFFICGILFAYFIVFPLGLKFFISYNTPDIKMLPSIKDYLSFSCMFLLAFGVVFEIPIFILLLAKIGIVNIKQLRSNRKFVIIVIFVLAAILTPPDAVSQILMAIPLLFLYELSIIFVKIFGKKRAE
jgi:sec-independent protein translocase protein TatC